MSEDRPVCWGDPHLLLQAIHACDRTLFVVDRECRVLAANWDVHAPGGTCYSMVCGDSKPCEQCPVERVFQTGEPVTRVVTGGARRCVYAFPIMEDGQVHAVAVGDIGELTGLEAEAHRTSAFLTNLIESSVDGVIAADMQGTIITFNKAAERILGYRSVDVVEKMHITKLYPSVEAAKEVMRRLRSDDHGGTGKIDSLRVDLLHPDGSIIPTNLSAALVMQNDEEVASVGFFKDMRARLHIEKELQEAQIQVMQSEKMASLGKLAAGVAHQINNPLGGITLYSQLVLEDLEEDHPNRPDLQRIVEDADRCKEIVKEMLVFARQTNREVRMLDLNHAIKQTMFLLENQALFHNIEVVWKLTEGLPQVPGDVQQLNHIFMNLILNAADAMEGKGTLTLQTGSSESEDEVYLSIGDTGCGIPAEIQSRIFDPFFTTKPVGKGTGLGLSMVYSIAHWHGGSVDVESEEGKGTTFTVRLPRGDRAREGDES